MRLGQYLLKTAAILCVSSVGAYPTVQQPLILNHANVNHTITPQLFSELEELSRVVDISYCVGVSGIVKPFQCVGRCRDFPNFELVKTWHTGPLLSDSCGYIALDHSSERPRIILAFRGTYSVANTVVDLSTVPQEYVPYIDDNGDVKSKNETSACHSCTVHMGFLHAWRNTRCTILPIVADLLQAHPTYSLHLVGHSLGGAIALLAGLEMSARDWHPTVTTFGEPRVGNEAFVAHVDAHFAADGKYRRVTHVDDPVPLLPLTEWGYLPHGGELFITKRSLPPNVQDIRQCHGDTDHECSASADNTLMELRANAFTNPAEIVANWEQWLASDVLEAEELADGPENALKRRDLIPLRFKLWQLFFAHRDYFWRLGLCLPGGDPWDWKRTYPRPNKESQISL